MATLHGYTDGSYDYKQKYNIKDLKGPLPYPVIHKNTLLGALNDNPDCLDFATIVKSIPEMAAKFNNIQASFTLFVPLKVLIHSRDSYKLRQFILLHTVEHALPYPFLSRTRMMYINSRLPGTKILVENLGSATPLLDRHSHIIGQQTVGNAVIYYIDESLLLDNNPLSNIDI